MRDMYESLHISETRCKFKSNQINENNKENVAPNNILNDEEIPVVINKIYSNTNSNPIKNKEKAGSKYIPNDEEIPVLANQIDSKSISNPKENKENAGSKCIPNDEEIPVVANQIDSKSISNLKENKENAGSKYILNGEEIPAVTIKNDICDKNDDRKEYEDSKKYDEKYDWKKRQSQKHDDSQKFMDLQIVDVVLSEIVNKKPVLYRFFGENYRFVVITGTVMKKQNLKDNKLCLEVDDSTGSIPCIVEIKEPDFVIEEACLNCVELNTEEILKFSKMKNNFFLENIGNKSEAFFNTVSKVFLKIVKTQWKECPSLTEDIKISDNVVIGGFVSDYKNQRYIFVKYLIRHLNISEFFDVIIDTIEKKDLIFEE